MVPESAIRGPKFDPKKYKNEQKRNKKSKQGLQDDFELLWAAISLLWRRTSFGGHVGSQDVPKIKEIIKRHLKQSILRKSWKVVGVRSGLETSLGNLPGTPPYASPVNEKK